MSNVFESLLRADQERGHEKDASDLGPQEQFFSSAGMASAAAAAVGKERPHTARARRNVSPMEDASRNEIAKLVQRLFLLSAGTKTVVFSAVESGAGCSWVAARAAETLAAQVNGTVCLVDANLRAPSLHRAYAANNGSGLTDAVLSSAGIESFTQELEIPGLWLLSSGSQTAGAEEMLASQAMRDRMRELRNTFEYVLIDAPPLSEYPDALAIGHWADGLALVLAANATHREPAQRAMKELEAAKVSVLGAVLNKRTYPVPRSLYEKL